MSCCFARNNSDDDFNSIPKHKNSIYDEDIEFEYESEKDLQNSINPLRKVYNKPDKSNLLLFKNNVGIHHDILVLSPVKAFKVMNPVDCGSDDPLPFNESEDAL